MRTRRSSRLAAAAAAVTAHPRHDVEEQTAGDEPTVVTDSCAGDEPVTDAYDQYEPVATAGDEPVTDAYDEDEPVATAGDEPVTDTYDQYEPVATAGDEPVTDTYDEDEPISTAGDERVADDASSCEENAQPLTNTQTHIPTACDDNDDDDAAPDTVSFSGGRQVSLLAQRQQAEQRRRREKERRERTTRMQRLRHEQKEHESRRRRARQSVEDELLLELQMEEQLEQQEQDGRQNDERSLARVRNGHEQQPGGKKQRRANKHRFFTESSAVDRDTDYLALKDYVELEPNTGGGAAGAGGTRFQAAAVCEADISVPALVGGQCVTSLKDRLLYASHRVKRISSKQLLRLKHKQAVSGKY